MKNTIFLLSSIIIASVLLQCNDGNSIRPDQDESVVVSLKSKGIGVLEYDVNSKMVSADSQVVNLSYTITSVETKRNVKMSFGKNEVLKLNFTNISNINNELVLNWKEMTLTFYDGLNRNVLRLRKEYKTDGDYNKAREIFDKNASMIKVLLSSSDDMLSNIDRNNIFRKNINKINPNFVLGDTECPQGGNYHTETSFASTRSLARMNSMNNLQFACNNSSCIGCQTTIGTDCACIFEDYGCSCTSRGCSCGN